MIFGEFIDTFSDFDTEPYLEHVGTPHAGSIPHSGRYPWGSGDHPLQRYVDFYSSYKKLEAQGKSKKEIAAELGVVNRFGEPDVKKLIARYSTARAEKKAEDAAYIWELYHEQGLSKMDIARKLGMPEATVRTYLDPEKVARLNINQETANLLKDYVDKYRYVDISPGVNIYLGVPQNRLDNAVALLEEQGYKKSLIKVDQMGTDNKTTISVLTPPDCTYAELAENRFDIRYPGQDGKVVDESGECFKLRLEKTQSIDSSRVMIRYNEEGGLDKDGLIQLRPGVDDISLGGMDYAQVRIGVDDHLYLKGMAVYDDRGMPPGVDVIFNTNKHVGTPFEEVLKPMKTDANGNVDWDNPFGASVTQLKWTDKDGKDHLCATNIVTPEGKWQDWDRNLASQFLSKQPVAMAQRQLGLSIADRKQEFDDICALTNPAVKKELLLKFADKCDSLAVDLKAAPFAGQQQHVLLPVPELKDNEVYAPNYPDGTRVALVRYPHQGIYEIPELTVRNTGSPAQAIIPKDAPDAIGINHNVADRLSGADFDGDSVVLIPLTDKVRVRTKELLDGLKGFDAKEQYHGYEGMPVLTKEATQLEMGKVSNLITDMTLKGADDKDLAAATRHAMVIIDANKHKLDYKRSEKDNHIADLKRKYQDNGDGKTGASTIISRAGSPENIEARKDWFPSSTSIGPNGEKIYKPTGETYMKGKLKNVTKKDGGEVSVNVDKKDGRLYYLQTDPGSGKKVRVYASEDDFTWIKTMKRTQEVKKMAIATDAYTLTSGGSKENPGYKIEAVYANFANEMKALGNKARLEYKKTPNQKYDPQAAVIYKAEVDSLNKKLEAAKSNAPRERQAQLLANRVISVKKHDNPDMTKDELKRLKGQAILGARKRVGAEKQRIVITPKEWEAIQHHAISHSKLGDILNNSDLDTLRQLATPRKTKAITPGMKALAKSMRSSGYTNAQIADRLGVSASSVSNIVSE